MEENKNLTNEEKELKDTDLKDVTGGGIYPLPDFVRDEAPDAEKALKDYGRGPEPRIFGIKEPAKGSVFEPRPYDH